MIHLGEVLIQLENLKCSVPIVLIGGIVDRGFTENDIDILDSELSLSFSKIQNLLTPDVVKALHQVPESQLGREAEPPKLIIGSPRLWDYAQKDQFHSDEFLNHSTRLWLSKLDLPGKRVLDVGCGDGYALEIIQLQGGEPTGISTSKENIAQLRENGFEAYLMDQNCLDFEDEFFDIVFSHHTLEHSIAPVLAVREAWRVLKPFSKADIKPGTLMQPQKGIFDLTISLARIPEHIYILNHQFLCDLLYREGFYINAHTMTHCGFSQELHFTATKVFSKANTKPDALPANIKPDDLVKAEKGG